MRKSRLACAIPFLGIALTAHAFTASDLRPEERAEFNHFVNSEVKGDLQDHLEERLLTAEFENTGKSEPITDEGREILLNGMYNKLVSFGLRINRGTFMLYMRRALAYSSRYGVYPRAITFGWDLRAQFELGASVGQQYNFYLQKGRLKVAAYQQASIEVGPEESAKFAPYVAFCYGECVGGDPKGMFVGFDLSASPGAGVSLFAQGGVDVTDLYKAKRAGKKYSLSDLYDTRAIYIGVAFSMGEGAGLSFGLYGYDLIFDRTITHIGEPLVADYIDRVVGEKPKTLD